MHSTQDNCHIQTDNLWSIKNINSHKITKTISRLSTQFLCTTSTKLSTISQRNLLTSRSNKAQSPRISYTMNLTKSQNLPFLTIPFPNHLARKNSSPAHNTTTTPSCKSATVIVKSDANSRPMMTITTFTMNWKRLKIKKSVSLKKDSKKEKPIECTTKIQSS